jgi:hypothetical protein
VDALNRADVVGTAPPQVEVRECLHYPYCYPYFAEMVVVVGGVDVVVVGVVGVVAVVAVVGVVVGVDAAGCGAEEDFGGMVVGVAGAYDGVC